MDTEWTEVRASTVSFYPWLYIPISRRGTFGNHKERKVRRAEGGLCVLCDLCGFRNFGDSPRKSPMTSSLNLIPQPFLLFTFFQHRRFAHKIFGIIPLISQIGIIWMRRKVFAWVAGSNSRHLLILAVRL